MKGPRERPSLLRSYRLPTKRQDIGGGGGRWAEHRPENGGKRLSYFGLPFPCGLSNVSSPRRLGGFMELSGVCLGAFTIAMVS